MAKKTVLNGKDFMIFVNNNATALSTSHRLTLSGEATDSASKDDGMWDESIITKMSWEASTEALVSAEEGADSYDTLFDLMLAAQPVTLILGSPSNKSNDGLPEDGWKVPTKGYTGKAIITSLERTDANGSNSTMSATFRGVGKLSKIGA